MKKVVHGTALLNAAATAFSGDGKKSSLPSLKDFSYVGCVVLGLLFIGIAVIQAQAVPALLGYGFLGLAVLLEPRVEAKHPVAEVVRLKATGVTRVYKAGVLLEETTWKAEALERKELLEHYQLMGFTARGSL